MRMEWAAIGLVAAVAMGAGQALAEGDKRFGEEILEILRDEGTIDDERYAELKAKEAAEALPAGDDWTITYKRGLHISRNDGMVKLDIGGRIQGDFASIHTSKSLDRSIPGGDGEGVEFRRARFYMSGEANERIIWKAQIDFANGSVELADMYIGMKGLGFLGTAKVGHVKQPYSLEELTSSKYITFMERSLASVFDSARNYGLSFSNTLFDERATWSAGVFSPTDGTGFNFSSTADLDVSGRVTGLPLYQEEGRRLIHVGLSGSFRSRDNTSVRFRQRPEIHLAQHYVDTGSQVTDGSGLLGAELAVVCGPFHISSEWKHTWIDEMVGGTSRAFGGYITTGIFLTGEHRPYKTSNGTWVGVDPLEPFDPSQGHWGSFEIATRYSYLEVEEKNLNGGRGQNIGVALNWYPYDSVRISVNYIYADVKKTGTGNSLFRTSGDIHGFLSRAQIEF